MPDESTGVEVVPTVETSLGRPAASSQNAAIVYLARFTTDKSKQTAIETMQRALAALRIPVESWDLAPWHQWGAEQTNALFQRLHVIGYKPRTIRMTMGVVRGVLKTAFQLGQIDAETYMRASEWPRVRGTSARVGRALGAEEIDLIRQYCNRMPAFQGAMVWALFALGLGGGLRREELRSVRADALSDDARAIRVVGKGHKEALQPLTEEVGGAVEAWLAQRARVPLICPALFVCVSKGQVKDRRMTRSELYHLLWRVGKAAGCKRFSPHDLRRTFATRLLDKEKVPLVQSLMRHAFPATTLTYDRSTEAESKAALDRTLGSMLTSEEKPPRSTQSS